MKITIINTPFVPLYIPSTAVGYISATIIGAGHDVAVADLNMQFANWLLPYAPHMENVWDRAHEDHLGQAIFSTLLFPDVIKSKAPELIELYQVETGMQLDELAAYAKLFCDQWLDQQALDQTDCIGFSVMNHQLLPTIYLAQQIRKRHPEVILLLGGFYVSGHSGQAVLSKMDEFDYAVYGEGEHTLLALLKVLSSGAQENQLKAVNGLIFRNVAGDVVVNPPRPNLVGGEIDDLSIPNYDWISKQDFERYRCSMPVLTIRGCYWGHCTFCSDFKFNRVSKSRSALSVANEIRWQSQKYGVQEFYFSDLATNDSIERVEQICDYLIEDKQQYKFRVLFIPDNISLCLLQKLKLAGCTTVQYGIENLNNTLLKKMGKAQRFLDNVRCIKLTEQAGMRAVSNLLRGMPAETVEEVIDNYQKILDFPEVFNGYVFGHSGVPFKLRDGASVEKYVQRRGADKVSRSISHHFWSDDWDVDIPDIEWAITPLHPTSSVYERVWSKIGTKLQQNEDHRRKTRYDDDGRSLKLSKYNHREAGYATYEFSGPSREIYHVLEDISTVEKVAARTGIDALTVAKVVDYFAAEKLVCVDKGHYIASIHPLVNEFDPQENRDRTVEQTEPSEKYSSSVSS